LGEKANILARIKTLVATPPEGDPATNPKTAGTTINSKIMPMLRRLQVLHRLQKCRRQLPHFSVETRRKSQVIFHRSPNFSKALQEHEESALSARIFVSKTNNKMTATISIESIVTRIAAPISMCVVFSILLPLVHCSIRVS